MIMFSQFRNRYFVERLSYLLKVLKVKDNDKNFHRNHDFDILRDLVNGP